MLPSSKSVESTSTRGRRSASGMKYLNNEMLSTTPKKAKILGVKTDNENKFGPRIVLKLAFEGQTIFWGVNIKKNPNYEVMEKQFGLEENDWVSKEILLNLIQDEFTENYFVRVSFPDKKGR